MMLLEHRFNIIRKKLENSEKKVVLISVARLGVFPPGWAACLESVERDTLIRVKGLAPYL